MHRITSWEYTAPLAVALECMAAFKPELLYFDVLTGTDPFWAGLHSDLEIGDGRFFATTAHASFPASPRQRPTIVVPVPETVLTFLHEIGHIVHFHLDFRPTLPPVTEYGKTNRYEAFAESFAAWFYPTENLPEASRYALEELCLLPSR